MNPSLSAERTVRSPSQKPISHTYTPWCVSCGRQKKTKIREGKNKLKDNGELTTIPKDSFS